MRGNRARGRRRRAGRRSIPACAGEPRSRRAGEDGAAVYPRVCGGTWPADHTVPLSAGLSPRVRGNQPSRSRHPDVNGSIPACAGEPRRRRRRCPGWTVYPRVCGGTRKELQNSKSMGLSPRVRGNHDGAGAVVLAGRSIPACAGEPGRSCRIPTPSTVYPRVCGGTHPPLLPDSAGLGLSPRVRGNPMVPNTFEASIGSIPACAGEPTPAVYPSSPVGVYPRVCGGTKFLPCGDAGELGLSPRVRGNRDGKGEQHEFNRSIPACAGEPGRRRRRCPGWTVYPRVCGGTTRW